MALAGYSYERNGDEVTSVALLHVDMQPKKMRVTKDFHDPVCAVEKDLVDDSRTKYFTQYLREWYVLSHSVCIPCT